jgi:gluconolactonase
MPDAAGGPSNKDGRLNAKVGQPAGAGVLKRELSCNVYRVDPSGRIDMVISEEALGAIPNGITFSPDYKQLYVVNNGMVSVLDVVGPAHQVGKPRRFADFMVDGITCRTDGIRADVFGNLWASSNAGANVGYSGVTVWNASGKLIGRIRLPETCANVAFGGPKRNRLFMAAGQSLYAVYTNTQGAGPG